MQTFYGKQQHGYYSSKGKSNGDLIDQLSDKGIVKSERVKAAMKK